ncbi:MAG TPA: glycosyltransferase family 4 protein [Abditibacteriaceae bacterium]|nr:glycosyltransferase family 4 protein [Abditibacteriaceae bacterium]
MKIAYVTTYDAMDVSKWSGLGHYIARALQNQSLALEYIGPLHEQYSLLFKAKQFFHKNLLHQNYLRDREPAIVHSYGRQVARRLSPDVDVVFSPGAVPVAYLDCRQPIAFWTDATLSGMVDFYPSFSNLCKASLDAGMALEQAALENCSLALYASDWAAQGAMNNFPAARSKVHVVPFGANIECDRTVDDVKTMIEARRSATCKLLFLGIDWLRKGGDVALEVARALNQAGLKTELTVVGCRPVTAALPDFVRSLGFISKSTPEGRALIDKSLAESHFLILPSRAEAYGVVFVEANSFGVPCLATRVGGIPTIIRNDLNGKTFALDAPIAEYCTYISNLMSDYDQYRNLALSAFNEYETRLNWSVAGRTVKKLLEGLTK